MAQAVNDAELDAQKTRVLAASERWSHCLGLGWWKVTHIWERAELASTTRDGRCCVAEVVVDWEYRLAAITWYLPTVALRDDDELEADFVHECCHVLVNEMRQWKDADDALQHEERVCTDLARAFLWVRGAGVDEMPTVSSGDSRASSPLANAVGDDGDLPLE